MHYRFGSGYVLRESVETEMGFLYACCHAYKVPAATGVVSCNAISGDTTTREVAQFFVSFTFNGVSRLA